MANKVILVFLDGVGVASENENNPFSQSKMDFIRRLINGPLTSEHTVIKPRIVFKGVDACLGVEGLPQSATGQTALFTGINAPLRIGYHFPAFPNKELIQIIDEHNIYKTLALHGKVSTFANAYTPDYSRLVREGRRKHSVTTVAALSAGLAFRKLEDLKVGRAVYWDITNRFLKERFGVDIETIAPYEAGKNLYGLTDENDLVVFESFRTDMIGHAKSKEEAFELCTMLDDFLKGVADNLGDRNTLVVASDHGNFEDLSTGAHTKNPALLLSIGAQAELFGECSAIPDLKEKIVGIILS
jgi:2,3-bisphosphoglycerate-independent phosphoglycerate mutase